VEYGKGVNNDVGHIWSLMIWFVLGVIAGTAIAQ
jgi:hypothetical protein